MGISPTGFWFGEDQSRYVIAAPDASGLLAAARIAHAFLPCSSGVAEGMN